MNKTYLWEAAGQGAKALNRLEYGLRRDRGTVVLFDPSIATDNLGDVIILRHCSSVLRALFPENSFASIATHVMPSAEDAENAEQAKYKFVCGTNLLTSHIEGHWRWVLPEGFRGKRKFRNGILLGCGWDAYQDGCSDYTRMIYRQLLNPCVLHSVRDSYTLEKLHQAGFRNVVNTGCPTTWNLTPEFCRQIPVQKAKDVVATVTAYRPDPDRDSEMLAILSRNYDHIHLWLQGKGDEAYLRTLTIPRNLRTVPGDLGAYEDVLKGGGVDYVGTRLHAGIHALNHRVRSLIVAVDNRAAEMGRDMNLPVMDRGVVGSALEERIRGEFAAQVRIPQENIDRFRAQFRR